MKKYSIILVLLAILLEFNACTSEKKDAEKIQQSLLRQTEHAQNVTQTLCESLNNNSFDSVWNITRQEEEILFYVFDTHGLVYWSQNWLSGKEVLLQRYDKWYYQQFENAHCVCQWSHINNYNILTVIPIKYNYAFENQQLHNEFAQPFKVSSDWDITFLKRSKHIAINDAEGNYLFSLCPCHRDNEKHIETTRLAESFSYQTLLTTGHEDNNGIGKKAKIRIYFLIMIIIFAVVMIWCVVSLIRSKGFQNLKLRAKFQYAFILLLFFGFLYIFVASIQYVRHHYKERQKKELVQKTQYIQKALQESYYWQASISKRNTQGLNVDLRDLSYAYETDIHVYDMNGALIGTSTPVLFEKGLISTHISPVPFFSESPDILLEEKIGDMRYLCAYTAFYNGSYVQIGYLAVPLFVSYDEVNAEVDDFISKLLPPYLIIMLLAFALSFIIARGLTQPLHSLSDKMQKFRIGNKNNKLSYNKTDEIGQLVEKYNEMVDALELSADKIAKSEREGAWRTMARQIAHEINNVLTPMKLTLQQLQRTHGTERFDNYFKHSTSLLIEQIDNLSRIATSFSTFAKLPEVKPAEVDIAQKLFSVISLFRNNQENVPIRYIGPESGVMAIADPEQIPQVFNNLIKNALQAIDNIEDGDIIVILKRLETAIEITISDNGCGIPEELRDKIFRPNFTTKSTGMGLGLAISKNIVEGSDGKIYFTTSEKGTTFYIQLKNT